MRIDVVIVGGSLAGAACARELARRGIDAVAFERDIFPRAKVCGGFLSPNAVECLEYLDLLDLVRTAGAVKVDHARINAMGRQIQLPFARNGLGISRSTLDTILAENAPVRQNTPVRSIVKKDDGAFLIKTDTETISARVVIDAAGKLSSFSCRLPTAEFGVQYTVDQKPNSALDFWFFKDGYGGGVSVEGGRSNFSFLIYKDAIRRYAGRPGCRVTGPLAYKRVSTGLIAIGDAAGMVDPFCGEGIHHALDSGCTAASVIAKGLRDGRTYPEMQQTFELESSRRWSRKRLMAGMIRTALRSPIVAGRLLGPRNACWFLDRVWARIPS